MTKKNTGLPEEDFVPDLLDPSLRPDTTPMGNTTIAIRVQDIRDALEEVITEEEKTETKKKKKKRSKFRHKG